METKLAVSPVRASAEEKRPAGARAPLLLEAYNPLARAGSAPLEAIIRQVQKVTEETRYFRETGRGRLYTLDALAPFERIGHGLPTLRATPERKFARARDSREFKARFARMVPVLAGFALGRWGLVAAGGGPSACLMHEHPQQDDAFGDIDLFLVGVDEEGGRRAIRALAAHLHEQTRYPPVKVSRTVNAITFVCKTQIVQVILRLYEAPLDVVGDFDLGSCSVLWDGEEVYLTAQGRLAVEHGVNLLNVASRRLTYERRLVRYFNRGFDIMLPRLDVTALAANSLPFLSIELDDEASECPCHIRPLRLTPITQGDRPRARDKWEDYGNERTINYACGDHVLFDRNLKALAKGSHQGLMARAVYQEHLDIFAIQPSIDPEEAFKRVWLGEQLAAPAVLKRVLGAALAYKVCQAAIDHAGNSAATARVVRELCRGWAEGLQAGAQIRFAFWKPDRADPGAQGVTEDQWYGREALPPQAPGPRVSGQVPSFRPAGSREPGVGPERFG